MPIDPFEGLSAFGEVVMRVKGTYVLTGGLVAVALSAPFTLPRVLESQGSAAFGLRVTAPPAARTAVVQMAALPQPKHVVQARPALIRATPHVAVTRSSGSSLAAVHTPRGGDGATPARAARRRRPRRGGRRGRGGKGGGQRRRARQGGGGGGRASRARRPENHQDPARRRGGGARRRPPPPPPKRRR